MTEVSLGSYEYEDLPSPPPGSFRVAEILAGNDSDPVSCSLHITDWQDPQEYEALSYAWGDVNAKATVICQGRKLEVTQSLYKGLAQLRYQDRSRFLFADAICINQPNIRERGYQVKQMRKIYESAKTVHSWLGPDTQDHQAVVAVGWIRAISDFLCQKLGVSISDMRSTNNIFQTLILRNKAHLPPPDKYEFSTDATWKSLIWFYSHQYFTRVWVVQELSANTERLVHCGSEVIEWERVDLVAGYITMETSFSKNFGFTHTYCWWVSTMTRLAKDQKNWLSLLYLASNYSCLDARDVIYGLRGLMQFTYGGELLNPDYSKTTLEVYRDSVECALLNFQNTDIFTYLTGDGNPSWIPQWNQPMLFRNPFRFGRALQWRPAGETMPIWDIDKRLNVISLTGFSADSVKYVSSYNESFFSNAMIQSDKGKSTLIQAWREILKTLEKTQPQKPLKASVITDAATSFSFGLDENSNLADESYLARNFVAYLKLILDEVTFNEYIPSELSKESAHANGLVFGKPTWDFKYSESTFFVTENNSIGCSISTIKPGDLVFIALGSTYPYMLRPDGDEYIMKGYAFVHEFMRGEKKNFKRQVYRIR